MRSAVGPETATSANATEGAGDRPPEQPKEKEEKRQPPQQQQQQQAEIVATTSSTANVIPTSPQYGVAIIETEVATTSASTTAFSEVVAEATAKLEDKDAAHSTPSRTNDRFKVVKIASLEPFKRGRWKCMDYVDEAPPPTLMPAAQTVKVSGASQQTGATMYVPSQSFPQHHIQQMLLQGGGYANAPQLFAAGQMVPHTQYCYPQPSQFVTTTQPYFQTIVPNSAGFAMLPQNYQYTFVQQPLVNGHAFPTEQQNGTTQSTKSVILNASQQPVQQQFVYQQNVAPLQNNPTVATQPQANFEPPPAQLVNSLPVLEGATSEASAAEASSGENQDDPAKTNPVVNAIDNKIEQAMDLVKSHLMYTVREEVEVLKEKIAELMERIQQLETENNFLRSQIPKNQQVQPQQQNQGGTPDPPAPAQ